MPLAPTGHEMATIRRDAGHLLRDNVQVWRPTYPVDGKGGRTITLTLLSNGPGALAVMGASDQEYFAAKIGSSRGWVITLAVNRDVNTDDQLRVSSRRFEVIGTDLGSSGAWLQRVPCREIV